MNSTEEFIYKGYIEGSENKPAVHLLGKRHMRNLYYSMPLDVDPEIGDEIRINFLDRFPYRKGHLLMGGVVCHD